MNIQTQEKNLEILYKLGFQCDFSEYNWDDEKDFYLSKKDGTGKIMAFVSSDGQVNGMTLQEFLALEN